jgi:DNA (cytosine-5)-methyltransferase 1
MSDVDTPNQPSQVLSLCSGMCGLERGIERAIGQLHVVAYVEIEAFIIQNLTALMEQGILDPAPIWSDLKTFPSKAFHQKLHGIIAGYPCQPFSIAGKQKGSADPRHLWPHIQQIIKSTQPVWCFFENVEGHLNLGYDEVYRSLRYMGYTVEADLFTAAEVGAPHKRTRLFILAVRTSELGNAQHHGHATGAQRGRHGQDNERCAQGQNMAEQFEGASELGNSHSRRKRRLQNEISTGQEHGAAGASGVHQREMDHTSSNGQQPNHQVPTRRHGIEPASKELADSTDKRKLPGSRQLKEHGRSGKQLEGPRPGCNAIDSHKDVPHAILPNGEQIRQEPAPRQFGSNGEIRGSGCHPELVEGWPLGPGLYQQPWEATRTIESGLGSTVNGYNFREDLLRMYGNGVVEQTVALAWVTLWQQITPSTNKP